MLPQMDAVRMNLGSNSTWQFATAEGDGNLADLAGVWRGNEQSWLGGASETESHCCLGSHSALPAPVHQISFTQQIFSGGKQRSGSKQLKLSNPTAKVSTVLMLIIDQMIKADEKIFFRGFVCFECVIVHLSSSLERLTKRSILSIKPESSSVCHAE